MVVAPSPILRLGSTGPDIIRLQERLCELGFDPVMTDGIYGTRTLRAVRAFQRSVDLPATGVVDPATWRALFPSSRPLPTTRPVAIRVLPNGLVLALATRRFRYQLGDAIEIMLTKLNLSQEPITLDYSSSQRFDLLIRDSDGNQVWQWSDGRAFLSVLGQVVLAPNEAITYRATWNVPPTAAPGSYTIVGWDTATQLSQYHLQITIQVV
ncbi:MAG: hypothetical protein HPY81_10465 [Firmicutes bacterium]|nr:hypothetical protein [Bacillota bacterium]